MLVMTPFVLLFDKYRYVQCSAAEQVKDSPQHGLPEQANLCFCSQQWLEVLQAICTALCEQPVGQSQYNSLLWCQGGLSVSTL